MLLFYSNCSGHFELLGRFDADCTRPKQCCQVEVTKQDMLDAMRNLVAAGARTSPLPAKKLPQYCVPLLNAQLQAATKMLNVAFPAAEERR